MKRISIALFIGGLLAMACNTAMAQRITVTMAGNNAPTFTGDGGWGKLGTLSGPHDVATDAAGNVYVTDQGNYRVRRIAAKDGRITTVAGGGSSMADGIPAVNAAITPKYMCADGPGNLYIVCSGSNQIRRIDAVTNIITTVAGTGVPGYSGDGGPAIAATFNGLLGLCIDLGGNLYVVDSGNNRVRKIAAGTGIVTTIAGTGAGSYTGDLGPATAATLHQANAITVNAAGDVFFMDQSAPYTSKLRKIEASTGIITTIAGTPGMGGTIFGATPTATWLGYCTGVCVDDSGNFYCNEISCSCREIDMVTNWTYPVAGDFGIESFSDNMHSDISYMNNPYGIAMDAHRNIYVADKFNNRVRKVVPLSHTPTFAYGKGAYLFMCPGESRDFDSLLTITDMDGLQTETFTLVTPPAHGSIAGLPASAVSNGTNSITRPGSVMTYTSASSYAGSDQFRVSVSDGSTSDTFTIYVDAGIASIAGNTSLCAGTTAQLSDEFGGGTWAATNTHASVSPTGLLTAASVGGDTIIYTATTSCGLMVTKQVVLVNTIPSPGVIVSATTVCAGATITVADGITGGVWTASNSHMTVSGTGVVTGVTPGTDTVYYTVTNSCGSQAASRVISVIHCSSTGVPLVSYPVPELFPNPVASVLTVQWDGLMSGTASVQITDVSGREVFSGTLNANGGNSAELNVSNLKDGVYLLNINNGNEHFTSKLVVSR